MRPAPPPLYTGAWRDWSEDGQLELDGTFRDGVLWEGKVCAYFAGHKYEGRYVDGKRREGRFLAGEGRHRYVETYAGGKRTLGATEVVWDGDPPAYEATFVYHSADGRKRYSISYSSRKKHGRWVEWDDNGKLASERFYWYGTAVREEEYGDLRKQELAAKAGKAEDVPAILVSDGRVVLVKAAGMFGALILRGQTMAPERMSYTWSYRKDGVGVFDEANKNVLSGTGTGSRVRFGPFDLAWSAAGDGEGWLYYRDGGWSRGATHAVELCVTTEESISGMDAAAPKWRYSSGPGACAPENRREAGD